MESSGQKETGHSQTEHTCAHLGHGAVVDLLLESQAAQQKGHTHDEQQVSQDRAQKRGLHDSNLVLDQSDDENDQLDGVAKGDVDQRADGVTQAASHALGSMAQQTRQGNDSDRVHCEDNSRTETCGLDGNAHWYKDQEDINPTVADGIRSMLAKPAAAISHTDEEVRFRVAVLLRGYCRSRPFGWRIHFSIVRRGRLRDLPGREFGRRSVRGGWDATRGCVGVSFRPRVNPVCRRTGSANASDSDNDNRDSSMEEFWEVKEATTYACISGTRS